MEEQMICGALELLNDAAKEDAQKGEDSSDTLSPINSEPGKYQVIIKTINCNCNINNYMIHLLPEPSLDRSHRKSSKAYLSQDETDVLYVSTGGTSLNVTAELPDSPSILRKLSTEPEARYSVLNESLSLHPRGGGSASVAAISEPISIPGRSPSRRGKGSKTGLSKNLSFSESVTLMSGSPLKSQSLGARDSAPKMSSYQGTKLSKSPGKERKVSRSFAAHMEKQGRSGAQSSSDVSSDESQTPLVMKPIPGDKHRKVNCSFITLPVSVS